MTPPSPPSGAPAPAHLQVTAKEFRFTLSRPTVAGGRVIIQFVNAGQDPHNLQIQPAAGGSDVGSFPLAQPGTRTDNTFELGAGTYTLYCSLPGHRALGMTATLTIN